MSLSSGLNRIYSIFHPSSLSHGPLAGLVNNEWVRLTALSWLLSKLQNTWSLFDPFGYILRYLYLESTHRQRGGDSFKWLLAFWQKHPNYLRKARQIDVETGLGSLETMSFPRFHGGPKAANPKPILSRGRDLLQDKEERLGLLYLPSDGQTFWFWHKQVLFCLTMHTVDSGSNGDYDMFGRRVTKEHFIVVRYVHISFARWTN